MHEAIGWIATALFVFSYYVKSSKGLKIMQATSAGLWVTYGIFISSFPVIAANALIILSALTSAFLKRDRSKVSA